MLPQLILWCYEICLLICFICFRYVLLWIFCLIENRNNENLEVISNNTCIRWHWDKEKCKTHWNAGDRPPPYLYTTLHYTPVIWAICYSHVGFNHIEIGHPVDFSAMRHNVKSKRNRVKQTDEICALASRSIKFWNSATKTNNTRPLPSQKQRHIYAKVRLEDQLGRKTLGNILVEIVPTQGLWINREPNKPDLANFATSSTWPLSLLLVEDIRQTKRNNNSSKIFFDKISVS